MNLQAERERQKKKELFQYNPKGAILVTRKYILSHHLSRAGPGQCSSQHANTPATSSVPARVYRDGEEADGENTVFLGLALTILM